MPASFGFHPAFRWPLPTAGARASHFIEFAVEESAPVRRLNAEGLVTSNRYPTPIRGRRLPLDDRLFMDDALILDAVRSRSVRYGTEVGPQIQVEFPSTPFLGLWSKPGAPFICIEPWHGIADPEGFSGSLTDKPGVFSVGPGAVAEVLVQIGLTTR
jgi:galactose mutarotase-like enzyme